MKRITPFAFVGLTIAALALASWFLVVVPGLAARAIQEQIIGKTGRGLKVDGGSSLQFSPQLGVAMHSVSLMGAETNSEPVVIAKTLFAPATFMQLLMLQISGQEIALEEPIFTLQYDAAGQSNIMRGEATSDRQTTGLPLRVRFDHGVVRYIDEPNAKSFVMMDVEGLADFDSKNQIHINAAMTVADERAHIALNLTSLSRAFNDGSPFDFNLDVGGAALSYAGRLVASKGIDLAGQMRVDTNDARRLFKWVGIDLHGINSKAPFSLATAVESTRDFIQFKNSEIMLSGMAAKGDVTYLSHAARPNLDLELKFENLNTDLFLNSTQHLSWSEKSYDLHNVNALDIVYRLVAKKLRVGVFETADARVNGTLKDGVLVSTVSSPNLGEAKINFNGHETPAKLGIEMALTVSDARAFMQQFVGMNWYSGAMTLNGKLETLGNSQSSMIGALNGQIEMKSSQAGFKGVSLSALAGKAIVQPVAGWDSGETDPVVFSSRFNVADGIANIQNHSLTAPGVAITASGEVDLLRQALKFDARVKSSRGDGKPALIAVEGPWANPTIGAKQSQ